MTPQRVMLWYLPAALIGALSGLMAVETAAANTSRPVNCDRKCGDVSIPYPFGISHDCAWPSPGFNISCNHSFSPPKPYFGNIEIKDITLEAGEARIYTAVLLDCFTSYNTTEHDDDNQTDIISSWQFYLHDSPFLFAPSKNEFTGIGCGTAAYLGGRDDGSYYTGCVTTCASLDDAAGDGEPCTGLGCCHVPSIPRNLTTLDIWSFGIGNPEWNRSAPCSSAFVAEKGWYNFSRQDFGRNGSKSFTMSDGLRSVPTVLDWAIRSNGSCSPVPPGAPACVSAHSYCVNATNGEGYLCNCSSGYAGNPYVVGGCINIDECNPSIYKERYPCQYGTCHDLEAIILAVAALSVLSVFLYMKHKERKLQDSFKRNGGHILERMGIKIFTKKDLKRITKDYSTIIGEGNFGKVYKGTTDDDQEVAVKCSIKVDEANRIDFTNEVDIQSRISHKNVVRLVGCCLQTDDPMLVFEYIPKGSLHDVLHGNGINCNDVRKQSISLQVRLDIAIESTEALAYLHTSANQKVLHGDIKSSNILIDNEFNPKVADFGISRLLPKTKHHTSLVVGDRSYMDPIYFRTGLLTEKSDVYSFGIVLLELITRKKAKYGENKSLQIDFVTSYKTDSRAREMFDNEIASPEVIGCLDMISRIAFQCLKDDVDERPTMEQVLEQLHLVRKELMDAKTRALELTNQIDGRNIHDINEFIVTTKNEILYPCYSGSKCEDTDIPVAAVHSQGTQEAAEQKLHKITTNYNDKLGDGAFGEVYKGITEEKHEVAFIPNGNLHDALHGVVHIHIPLLVRMDIAIGSAEALAYMHSNIDHNSIVHEDIKSSNILLDSNMKPKVSDFGSYKLMSVAIYDKWSVFGDLNYIDPVYFRMGDFMDKSDVYGFSVVLLELITRKNVKYDGTKLHVQFDKHHKDDDSRRSMYDQDMLCTEAMQNHCIECLDIMTAIAAQCVTENVDERPTMVHGRSVGGS
uniref:Protein kinase domain-containing protein n=1 Tax=Leersia perrieri TaxID=77586 RepID=A0A0D9X6D7_9ORYZ